MTREEYDAFTRLDLNLFVERVFAELNGSEPYLDNFHIGVICAELEAVRRGKARRLAIALPPRSLKSIIVSVAFPAWVLGHDPGAKLICASYGQVLAEKLARDCRQVIRSDWYRHLFPATRLAADGQATARMETTAGGMRYATSVGGVVTGFGADLIIVDDPMKPEEAASDAERARANAWAQHTLFTRLNDKARGSIVLVMQRLHESDMIGHLAATADLRLLSFAAIAQADEVHAYRTPYGKVSHVRREGEALHEEREPIVVLEDIRRAIGSRWFAAQYLQMPSPPGGSLVKPEWFGRFDPLNLPRFDQIIQSWDTASRGSEIADYSVCTTWGKKGKQLFLLSVLRKRLEYPELKRLVVAQANLFAADVVLVEDAASGIALSQDLTNDGFYKVKPVKPKGDKIIRLQSVTAMIEAGQVFVPHEASWLQDYFHELMMFPASRYDDQADSTSQALSYVMTADNSAEAWVRMLAQRAGLEPDEEFGSAPTSHTREWQGYNRPSRGSCKAAECYAAIFQCPQRADMY